MSDVVGYQEGSDTRPPEGARLLQWAVVMLAILGGLFLILFVAGVLSPPEPLPVEEVRTTSGLGASVEQQEAERELLRNVTEVLEPMRAGVDGEFGYDVKGDVVHLTGAVRGINDIERLATAAADVPGVSAVETSAIETRGLHPAT